MDSENEASAEINSLKLLLAQTDYQALKFSDGAMAEDEYAPIRQKRGSGARESTNLNRKLRPSDVKP